MEGYVLFNVRSSRPRLVSCFFKGPDSEHFFYFDVVGHSLWQLLNPAIAAQKQPKVIHKRRNMAVFQETFLFTKRE